MVASALVGSIAQFRSSSQQVNDADSSAPGAATSPTEPTPMDQPDDNEERPMLRRSTDLSKAMLPLWLTMTLIGGSLSAAGGVWALVVQVSNINTRMDADKELRTEQMTNLKGDVNDLKESVNRTAAEQRLQQYEIQQLKATVQRLETLIDGGRRPQ